MKWRAETNGDEPRSFEVDHDPFVGFYLNVFENGKCVQDHLQDTFEMAVLFAFLEFGVPEESWRKIEN